MRRQESSDLFHKNSTAASPDIYLGSQQGFEFLVLSPSWQILKQLSPKDVRGMSSEDSPTEARYLLHGALEMSGSGCLSSAFVFMLHVFLF